MKVVTLYRSRWTYALYMIINLKSTLATVEVSKPDPSEEKDEHDSSKLCRESKDSIDVIWDLQKDTTYDAKSWSIQISGATGVQLPPPTTHNTAFMS